MSIEAGRRSAHAIISSAVIMAMYIGVQSCEYREPKPVPSVPQKLRLPPPLLSSQLTPKETKLVAFFQKQKSPVPVEMAKAVAKRKPRNIPILAAMAVRESGADPKAIGAVGEQGAFQVQRKHWGVVPNDPEGQARQAERILEDLLKSSQRVRPEAKRMKVALAMYNGGKDYPQSSKRYAASVLALSKEIKDAMRD